MTKDVIKDVASFMLCVTVFVGLAMTIATIVGLWAYGICVIQGVCQ